MNENPCDLYKDGKMCEKPWKVLLISSLYLQPFQSLVAQEMTATTEADLRKQLLPHPVKCEKDQ